MRGFYRIFKRGGGRFFLSWLIVHKKIGRILSDKAYIELVYYLKTSNRLNLTNPITFNEKLQWLKLFDHNPEYTRMVDKYDAKLWVSEKIGNEVGKILHIVPTYGVWDDFDKINFDNLPNQFVLKCTHDSGSICICREKNTFDIEKAKKKIAKRMKRNGYWYAREWPYKNVKPRIIAEKYLYDTDNVEKGLIDYKFYCFNGEPKFLYVSEGAESHTTEKISYVSFEWKKTEFERTDYRPFEILPPKPMHFEKMIEYARKLSDNVPFLRVDFYEVNGEMYFSELTFFPAGGYAPFSPPEYDRKVGEWLQLPIK